MERVRTGTADHVHLAADDSAVLGRQHALDDLDLRHSLDAHDIDLILRAVLRHGAAFRVGVRLGAVHGDTRSAGRDTIHPHRAIVS